LENDGRSHNGSRLKIIRSATKDNEGFHLRFAPAKTHFQECNEGECDFNGLTETESKTILNYLEIF